MSSVLPLVCIAVFLRNADLDRVWSAVAAARADFLALSVVLTALTFVIRAERWQYLLGPLGPTKFRNVFRTTVIGFAASAVLPARAGEVIRPYLLARKEGLSATAAFATILVERVIDLVAVLLLLLAFLLWFDPGVESRDSAVFSAIRFGGLVMAPVAVGALLLMFFMAGHPEQPARVAAEGRTDPAGARRGGAREARADVCGGICRGAPAGAAGGGAGVVDRVVDHDCRRHLGGGRRIRDRDAVHRRAG